MIRNSNVGFHRGNAPTNAPMNPAIMNPSYVDFQNGSAFRKDDDKESGYYTKYQPSGGLDSNDPRKGNSTGVHVLNSNPNRREPSPAEERKRQSLTLITSQQSNRGSSSVTTPTTGQRPSYNSTSSQIEGIKKAITDKTNAASEIRSWGGGGGGPSKDGEFNMQFNLMGSGYMGTGIFGIYNHHQMRKEELLALMNIVCNQCLRRNRDQKAKRRKFILKNFQTNSVDFSLRMYLDDIKQNYEYAQKYYRQFRHLDIFQNDTGDLERQKILNETIKEEIKEEREMLKSQMQSLVNMQINSGIDEGALGSRPNTASTQLTVSAGSGETQPPGSVVGGLLRAPGGNSKNYSQFRHGSPSLMSSQVSVMSLSKLPVIGFRPVSQQMNRIGTSAIRTYQDFILDESDPANRVLENALNPGRPQTAHARTSLIPIGAHGMSPMMASLDVMNRTSPVGFPIKSGGGMFPESPNGHPGNPTGRPSNDTGGALGIPGSSHTAGNGPPSARQNANADNFYKRHLRANSNSSSPHYRMRSAEFKSTVDGKAGTFTFVTGYKHKMSRPNTALAVATPGLGTKKLEGESHINQSLGKNRKVDYFVLDSIFRYLIKKTCAKSNNFEMVWRDYFTEHEIREVEIGEEEDKNWQTVHEMTVDLRHGKQQKLRDAVKIAHEYIIDKEKELRDDHISDAHAMPNNTDLHEKGIATAETDFERGGHVFNLRMGVALAACLGGSLEVFQLVDPLSFMKRDELYGRPLNNEERSYLAMAAALGGNPAIYKLCECPFLEYSYKVKVSICAALSASVPVWEIIRGPMYIDYPDKVRVTAAAKIGGNMDIYRSCLSSVFLMERDAIMLSQLDYGEGTWLESCEPELDRIMGSPGQASMREGMHSAMGAGSSEMGSLGTITQSDLNASGLSWKSQGMHSQGVQSQMDGTGMSWRSGGVKSRAGLESVGGQSMGSLSLASTNLTVSSNVPSTTANGFEAFPNFHSSGFEGSNGEINAWLKAPQESQNVHNQCLNVEECLVEGTTSSKEFRNTKGSSSAGKGGKKDNKSSTTPIDADGKPIPKGGWKNTGMVPSLDSFLPDLFERSNHSQYSYNHYSNQSHERGLKNTVGGMACIMHKLMNNGKDWVKYQKAGPLAIFNEHNISEEDRFDYYSAFRDGILHSRSGGGIITRGGVDTRGDGLSTSRGGDICQTPAGAQIIDRGLMTAQATAPGFINASLQEENEDAYHERNVGEDVGDVISDDHQGFVGVRGGHSNSEFSRSEFSRPPTRGQFDIAIGSRPPTRNQDGMSIIGGDPLADDGLEPESRDNLHSSDVQTVVQTVSKEDKSRPSTRGQVMWKDVVDQTEFIVDRIGSSISQQSRQSVECETHAISQTSQTAGSETHSLSIAPGRQNQALESKLSSRFSKTSRPLTVATETTKGLGTMDSQMLSPGGRKKMGPLSPVLGRQSVSPTAAMSRGMPNKLARMVTAERTKPIDGTTTPSAYIGKSTLMAPGMANLRKGGMGTPNSAGGIVAGGIESIISGIFSEAKSEKELKREIEKTRRSLSHGGALAPGKKAGLDIITSNEATTGMGGNLTGDFHTTGMRKPPTTSRDGRRVAGKRSNKLMLGGQSKTTPLSQDDKPRTAKSFGLVRNLDGKVMNIADDLNDLGQTSIGDPHLTLNKPTLDILAAGAHPSPLRLSAVSAQSQISGLPGMHTPGGSLIKSTGTITKKIGFKNPTLRDYSKERSSSKDDGKDAAKGAAESPTGKSMDVPGSPTRKTRVSSTPATGRMSKSDRKGIADAYNQGMHSKAGRSPKNGRHPSEIPIEEEQAAMLKHYTHTVHYLDDEIVTVRKVRQSKKSQKTITMEQERAEKEKLMSKGPAFGSRAWRDCW